MIEVGDTVVFLYVKPNDMGGITLHKETGLKVDEITEEWDRGRKILMARVGRTKYALEFLRKVKTMTEHTEEYITHDFEEDEGVENCPFCGDSVGDELLELLETGDHETWFIYCVNCNLHGPSGISRENAISLWNMRDGEEVRKQFQRLNDESVLPMAVDNGEEVIVASIGNGKAKGTPFFNDITLLHRDPNGKETFGRYRFVEIEELPTSEPV